MNEAMQGSGVQAIKMRGGMPLLGAGRVFGFYRFANMLALLDRKLRLEAPPDEILGSRGFDNYAWHTDLPPGTRWSPAARPSTSICSPSSMPLIVLIIGMNWICTKMPDGHWLSDARLKGTRVIVIVGRLHADGQQGRRDGHPAARDRRGPVPGRGREIIAKSLRPGRGT